MDVGEIGSIGRITRDEGSERLQDDLLLCDRVALVAQLSASKS